MKSNQHNISHHQLKLHVRKDIKFNKMHHSTSILSIHIHIQKTYRYLSRGTIVLTVLYFVFQIIFYLFCYFNATVHVLVYVDITMYLYPRTSKRHPISDQYLYGIFHPSIHRHHLTQSYCTPRRLLIEPQQQIHSSRSCILFYSADHILHHTSYILNHTSYIILLAALKDEFNICCILRVVSDSPEQQQQQRQQRHCCLPVSVGVGVSLFIICCPHKKHPYHHPNLNLNLNLNLR